MQICSLRILRGDLQLIRYITHAISFMFGCTTTPFSIVNRANMHCLVGPHPQNEDAKAMRRNE